MPSNRFYLPLPLVEGEQVELRDQEHYHLKNVMRNKPGDKIELIDGQNRLAFALLEHIDRHHTIALIEKVVARPSPYPLVHLVIGLSTPSKLELALEKCTELGASAFTLIPMKLSKKKHLSAKEISRLEMTLISATKQCGRLDLPTLSIVDSLSSLTVPETINQVLIADLNASVRPKPEKERNTLSFIGPESGFTDEEIAFIKEKHKAHSVLLHYNTLRFETACMAATLLSVFE